MPQQRNEQINNLLVKSHSSSASDLTMITPNTEKIRHALRLVHCIQKERGSSCAYYANNTLFESPMHKARTDSDTSIKFMRPYTDLPIDSSLKKIRALIDADKNPHDPANDLIFHRIFVCFNTLISSVVHECVLKHLGRVHDNESGKARGGSNIDQQKVSKPKEGHTRHLSSDINNHLESNQWDTIGTPERITNFRKTFAFQDDEAEVQHEHAPKAALPPDKNDTTTPSPTQQEVQQLLDLLKLFVQLKESAGVERAILSSLLAFRNSHKDVNDDDKVSNRSLPSFRMLNNDLILEVENQRAIYSKLEKLPSGQHHSLVLELAELSPRLKDLQQIILTDFDSLRGAKFDSETIWDMITLYIDKLHSVELLIIEDLDLACDGMRRTLSTSTGSNSERKHMFQQTEESQEANADRVVDRALEKIGSSSPGDGSGVSQELLAEIRRMSPEELKNRVLGLLSGSTVQGDVSPSNASARNKSRSVSLYAESSAAHILSQDMNNALHQPPDRSKEWEISIYDIKFQKRLGQGACATTYLGKWTGQNVAVKVASTTDFGLEGWRTEVNALQRLHHPNIIRLMGSIYNENPQTHCLVLEYCNAGDLGAALRYPTPRNFFFHVSSSIANAMSYLHHRGIIHRDLKPANVLCDGNIASGNFVVKITDFGIATDITRFQALAKEGDSGNPTKLSGETGTYRWMSPEVIRHEPYSTPADVFSFAIMLWQFVSHEEPYSDLSSVEAAKLVGMEKKRMSFPMATPQSLVELIETNWDDDPTNRNSFVEIVESIQTLQESLPDADLEWLEEPHGHPIYAVADTDDLDSTLQEAFKQQPLAEGPSKRSERSSSLGKKLRRSASARGKSPNGRKPSLLSSFFRKPSFEHGKTQRDFSQSQS
jgi:mitogen-activated protein kinase kinase kinase 11